MIIDLPRFIEAERPLWAELESMLDRMESNATLHLDLQQTQRFHYLYQRVLSDLGRIVTFSSEPETRRYLESLSARAYGEMNETRDKSLRFSPLKWLTIGFPRVFRKHVAFFWLSCAVFLAGGFFGAAMLMIEPKAKQDLMPRQFSHLYQTPTERVKEEESSKHDHLSGEHAEFSTSLMANNIQVGLYTFGSGILFGIGTLVFLFGNGITLGLVVCDYMQDGQTTFMLAWLLPHGVFEIPAILIAGQAGLLLGRTLLGRGGRETLSQRFRAARPDLALLMFGVSVMLVWAGLIESFFSQYHQPVLPYWLKIGFAMVELALLVWFLAASGKAEEPEEEP